MMREHAARSVVPLNKLLRSPCNSFFRTRLNHIHMLHRRAPSSLPGTPSRRNPRLTAAGHERAPSVSRLSAFMSASWSRSDKACGGSRPSMSSRSDSASTDELHDQLSQSVPMGPRPPTIQCGEGEVETRQRGAKTFGTPSRASLPGTPSRAKTWVRERVRKSSTETMRVYVDRTDRRPQMKERVRRSSAEGGNSLFSWARNSISSPRRRRRSIAETPMEQAFAR